MEVLLELCAYVRPGGSESLGHPSLQIFFESQHGYRLLMKGTGPGHMPGSLWGGRLKASCTCIHEIRKAIKDMFLVTTR